MLDFYLIPIASLSYYPSPIEEPRIGCSRMLVTCLVFELNEKQMLNYCLYLLLKLSPQTNDTLKKLHLLLGRWWMYTSNTSNARLFHNVSRNWLQNWFVRLGRCRSRSRRCNGTKLIWPRSVTLKSDTRNIHKKIESLERKIPINKLVYCSINAELCETFVFLCIAIAVLVRKLGIDQVLVISWTK